ncbi:MAG: hypothetical protein QXH20_02445 [Candidatus Bathyarchaeia archaeon]
MSKPKLLYKVERQIRGTWKTVAICDSLHKAVELVKILGKDTRITTITHTENKPIQPPKPHTINPKERCIENFTPLWISPYIAQSIKQCGDMSLAYDLLLNEYIPPRKPKKLNNNFIP